MFKCLTSESASALPNRRRLGGFSGLFLAGLFLTWLCLSVVGAYGQVGGFSMGGPFEWTLGVGEDGAALVEALVPAAHYLYAEQTTLAAVDANGAAVVARDEPIGEPYQDEFFGEVRILPEGRHVWKFPSGTVRVEVSYQGCRGAGVAGGALCFAPARKVLGAAVAPSVVPLSSATGGASSLEEQLAELRGLLEGYGHGPRGVGYLGPREFVGFLDSDSGGGGWLEDKSLPVVVLLVLIGGLLLNLTPCVLPMVPVNLAIIGAGAAAKSRFDGFVRGGVYGLGVAVAYGGLGLAAATTGMTFGTLNSTAAFNFFVALVFLALALAMLDKLSIDFSRFGGKLFAGRPGGGGARNLAAVAALGAVSALLAGACVAPVVIAVLLYSTNLTAAGNPVGIFLPFLLGIGMALPWPFAGGGLALLPKPGRWMGRIKIVFAVVIVAFGVYYASLGVSIARSTWFGERRDIRGDGLPELVAALERGLDEGRPVFIDFWATWCPACVRMNNDTFPDAAVEEALAEYLVVKFQAEDPRNPRVAAVLEMFEVVGLPTYLVLHPL